MSTTTIPDAGRSGAGGQQTIATAATVGIGLAILADWLFYQRPIGVSVVLFAAALLAVSACVNRASVTRRSVCLACLALALCLLPVAVELTTLSALFAIIGTAAAVLIATGNMIGTPLQKLLRAGAVLLLFPVQISDDLSRVRLANSDQIARRLGNVAIWALPIGLGIVFSMLLVSANPLLENWLGKIDVKAIIAALDPIRIVFWLLVAAGTWSIVWVRRWNPPQAMGLSDDVAGPAVAMTRSAYFGEAAILRSLLVFNAIFAVQTVMDLVYLWAGSNLPDGMSLATYAHRGAYPLIATALLAGAFVVAAMRPDGAGRSKPLVRGLVYLWIAQNVALVLSAILRLKLYVEVYSLSYLRVAAFIWMLLVAVGLLLIVVQITGRRSNGWLVAANAVAAAAALYACCFVNFTAVIADYNITHSRSLGGPWQAGGPVALDTCYLLSLGPQAIPAIDKLAETGRQINCPFRNSYGIPQTTTSRNDMAVQHLRQATDWRGLSWRGSRLTTYLRNVEAAVPK